MAHYELHRPDGAVESERQGSLTYRWVPFAPSKVDEVWLHQHECKSHSDTFLATQNKQKKYSKKHKYRESRRRHQSHRRQKPPPLQRYAGDVLAPVGPCEKPDIYQMFQLL